MDTPEASSTTDEQHLGQAAAGLSISATHITFGIVELFEDIITRLPPFAIWTARGTCRHWYYNITTSTVIRKAVVVSPLRNGHIWAQWMQARREGCLPRYATETDVRLHPTLEYAVDPALKSHDTSLAIPEERRFLMVEAKMVANPNATHHHSERSVSLPSTNRPADRHQILTSSESRTSGQSPTSRGHFAINRRDSRSEADTTDGDEKEYDSADGAGAIQTSLIPRGMAVVRENLSTFESSKHLLATWPPCRAVRYF